MVIWCSGKIDAEAQPALAGAFEISSIPTLMIGALPEAAPDELIDKARALDMDEVRGKFAVQREA
ncbi:hypothetical protein KDK95_30895 [Actinospica sp. MGRD01-02]|uniref:Thioredoxin-like fold domain-containing protein n=1 Tax=Actinospica acidithermotolerans TaxID=2828514 RepID=A0A941EG89_9ACTN|nr:hypothetical protein [Actinospica acidithermotolerans]MBR7830751.1 hypothetical protein [Actinospica acidithermotolerans]